MIGREDSINKDLLNNHTASGIIPKSIKVLFNLIQANKHQYTIKASFLEIYNERINDLLNPKNSENLKIRRSKNQGHFVEGLLIVDCQEPNDLLEVLIEGTNNRKVGSHYLNSDSSRSHSILTLNIVCKEKNRFSMLNFVDLAGSERLKDSKAQGEMIKETGNINKSLLTLGKVISILAEKTTTSSYIPYRDSKLTLLLSNSFGGSSKTLMIGCVSSSTIFIDETLSTLILASKAINIINNPFILFSIFFLYLYLITLI
jgi:kinesin family protein 12